MHRVGDHMLDAFLVVLAVAEAFGLALSDQDGRFVAAGLAAAAALVLLLRRRGALVVSVVAFGLLAGSLIAAPQSPNVQFFGLMASFAVVAAMNTTRNGVLAWLAGATLLGVAAAISAGGGWLGDFLLTLAFCTVMWVAGWLVSRHTRRAEVMTLRARAAEQARVIALREERARIARELHDVVSHGLSVVVLQTMAARSALEDGDSGEIDRHLDAVEATARDALGEMRRMLGLLQVDDLTEPDASAPSPGLRHVHTLIERARAAGLDVEHSGLDTITATSSGVELALYRIVQEALTNAAKHAPGARVRLSLRRDAGQITVEIVNDGGQRGAEALLDGAGHGLVGMRERVALYHGTLHAGPTLIGGFEVRATLPLDSAAATTSSAVPR